MFNNLDEIEILGPDEIDNYQEPSDTPIVDASEQKINLPPNVEDEFRILSAEEMDAASNNKDEADKFKDTSNFYTADKSKETNQNKNDKVDDFYYMQLKAFKEEGILNIDDKKLESLKGKVSKDSFVELINEAKLAEAQKMVEEFKSSLSPKAKSIFGIVSEIGDDDEVLTVAEQIAELEAVDNNKLDDLNLQKNIYKQDLLDRGYSDEKAEEMVAEAYDLDKLKSRALEAKEARLTRLKASANQIKETREVKQKEEVEKTTKTLNSFKEKIKQAKVIGTNIPATAELKDKILKSMFEPIETTPDGRQINAVQKHRTTNPLEFEKAIHTLYHLGVLNLDEKTKEWKPDFSKISASVKKSTMDEIAERAAKEQTGYSPKGNATNEQSGGILDVLRSVVKD